MLLLLCMSKATAADDSFEKTVAPFLKQHCYSCHNEKKQESRLRLDTLTNFRNEERSLWTLVHEKVSTGEMPPKSREQPSDDDKKRFLAWIAIQQRSTPIGGTRRLNRREVAGALRDLTGLNVDYANSLPADGKLAGFDTGAETLQDAADSVVVWMQVARRAVDGLRFLEPASGKQFSANFRTAKDPRKVLDEWKNDGATGKSQGIAKPGTGLLLEPRAVGEREGQTIYLPVPADRQGILRLRLVVSALKPMEGLPNSRLWVEIGGKDVDYAEITSTDEKPQHLVYQVQLEDLAIQSRGVEVTLRNRLELPYAVKGFENDDRSKLTDMIPGGTGLFRPIIDRKAPPEKWPAPFLVLQQMDIEPNHVAPWPPPEWKADVGEAKDTTEYATKLLALWMERAWRRPVAEKEREPFLKLYHQLRKEEKSFDDALRAAFQAVLVSAPFRYLASPTHSDATTAQFAIASRLSFMLIGEPPDRELRRLAAAGKLRDPKILDEQVDRLLTDPRSQGFIRPFVMQWLEMEQPITIAMSHIQKQDFRFARYLKASMREETLSYVGRLFADNRPARELVVSDWTMMNDILAIHYGYKGVEGGEFRKLKLRDDDPRGGGILGHAGIQSMLCWMGDNWIIYRGAWTLRHVLDYPPPPPPLEVPELNPGEGKNKGKPFRVLLKQHQEDTRCAVCHKNIDPVGFAFQNFDLSGRWRDEEYESYERSELDGKIAWNGVGKTRAVDTVGRFPRGEEFKTFAEFKKIVVKDYQTDMVRGLLKNLIIYATGRTADVEDRKEIAELMKALAAKEYPLRELLKGIIRSRAFLER